MGHPKASRSVALVLGAVLQACSLLTTVDELSSGGVRPGADAETPDASDASDAARASDVTVGAESGDGADRDGAMKEGGADARDGSGDAQDGASPDANRDTGEDASSGDADAGGPRDTGTDVTLSPDGPAADSGTSIADSGSPDSGDSAVPPPMDGGSVVVATTATTARGLAVDTTNVYWTEQGGFVKSHAKDGSGATTTLATTQSTPYDVLLDPSYLYWSLQAPYPDAGACAIMRANVDGSGASCIGALPLQGSPYVDGRTSIAPDGTGLYLGVAANGGGPSLAHVDAQSGFSYVLGGAAGAIAAGQNVVAFASDGVSLDDYYPTSQSSEQVIDFEEQIVDIAVDSSDTTFFLTADGHLYSSLLGSTSATTVATIGQPQRLAVDASNVYVTTVAGSIVWVAKTGGNPQPLATGQSFPVAVAIDATAVYWENTGDGTIASAPKP